MSTSELVVIGGGPAGLSTAVFAASEGIQTTLITQTVGGQASSSAMVENYLGFPVGIPGDDLAHAGIAQAYRMGVDVRSGITVTDVYRRVGADNTYDGPAYPVYVGWQDQHIFAKAIVVATGMDYRVLDQLPASNHVTYGKGTKSFPVQHGHRYLVYGGANSAAQAAVDLAERGGRVVLACRSTIAKETSAYMQDKLRNAGVKVREYTTVTKSEEGSKAVAIGLNDAPMTAFGHAFVFIGGIPCLPKDHDMQLDAKGKIVTARDGSYSPFESTEHGIFAVGDVRSGSIPRIAAAVGEGAAVVPYIWALVKGV